MNPAISDAFSFETDKIGITELRERHWRPDGWAMFPN